MTESPAQVSSIEVEILGGQESRSPQICTMSGQTTSAKKTKISVKQKLSGPVCVRNAINVMTLQFLVYELHIAFIRQN